MHGMIWFFSIQRKHCIAFTRFALFCAFIILHLSMTFSMTSSMSFPSFPWPKWTSYSQNIVKTIYYLRYFPTLWRVKCVLVFILLLDLKPFLYLSVSFQLFVPFPFYSQKVYYFSMTRNQFTNVYTDTKQSTNLNI